MGFGGHVDTHGNATRTGCTAVDSLIAVSDKSISPAAKPMLSFLASQAIGDSYSQKVFGETLENIAEVKSAQDIYFPSGYKHEAVDIQRSEAEGSDNVPALYGDHREFAVVLNYRNNTTVDTDRFAADHGDDIQVFGWDVWEMQEESKRLHPDSPEKQAKHLMARTVLGLATAMVLTDGSLKLITVQ